MLISVNAGHSKYVHGMVGFLVEKDETILVADATLKWLKAAGHDARLAPNEGHSVPEYLREEYGHANSIGAELAVSHHFNSYNGSARGVEVLVHPNTSKANKILASKVSKSLASAMNIPNRGVKERTNLAFLNYTKCPAMLIEVCFGDNCLDVDAYNRLTPDGVGKVIAEAINGASIGGSTKTVNDREEPKVEHERWEHKDDKTYLYIDGKLYKGERLVDAGDHVTRQFFDLKDGHLLKGNPFTEVKIYVDEWGAHHEVLVD